MTELLIAMGLIGELIVAHDIGFWARFADPLA